MHNNTIKTFLKHLGFNQNNNSLYTKKYKNHNNYEIKINIEKGKIYYRDDDKTLEQENRKKDSKIQLGDKTSSHFKNNVDIEKQESFVVLDAVNRLLEKGYSPNDIHIEKKWKLGHGASGGKSDITIYDNTSIKTKTLFVIECKTYGKEFDKEKKKMLEHGGQLFSYLQQDKNANALVLYATDFTNENYDYQNIIVKIEDNIEKLKKIKEELSDKKQIEKYSYKNANQKTELFFVWQKAYNKFFYSNGIFEDDVSAYSIKLSPLKKKDLKTLKSVQGLFNQYMEILRHNNISESDRAFNKLLSLFLCKIVDEEEKKETALLDFQVIEGESDEKLHDKLQRLFKEGMKKYLGFDDFVYFSDEDVEKNIKDFPKRKPLEDIIDIFKQIKYYTNNEFSFKDVFNKDLFYKNTKILKEVIDMLQLYKFKNDYKDQFLGDFFELLLNHGVKQSSGQFFTPIPIVKFIILSLNLEKSLKKNLKEKNSVDKNAKFLKTLDYACGAGHFLIEVIAEMDKINKKINLSNENINQWTKKYIFGIEKDDRLARTAKIACFLNGDGEANIIYGDGLKKHQKLKEKFEKFDLVIVNPPYAVKGFKNYVDLDDREKESYQLFNKLGENSSEIEVLFIERTKQVLKEDGQAGIILPSSILSNTGIYSRAREVILKHFDIIAITELGSKTFIATGTNTVVLFLKKKADRYPIDYKRASNEIFQNYEFYENDYIKTEFLIDEFIKYRKFKKEDYHNFLQNKLINDELAKNEIFQEYENHFEQLTEIKNFKKKLFFRNLSKEKQEKELLNKYMDMVVKKEEEKFYYFCLTHQKKTLIIKSPSDNNKQKDFLGYEFKGRRGSEGITIYKDNNGKESTKLFDEEDNSQKMNFYIKNAFFNDYQDINEEVKEFIKIVNTTDLLNFEKTNFEKIINTNVTSKIEIKTKWELMKLGNVCEINIGGTPDRQKQEYWQNGNNLWLSVAEMNNQIIIDTKEKINDLGVKNSNVKLVKKGTVLLSFKLSIGKIAIAGKDLYTNEAIASLKIKNNDLLNKYLFILFKNKIINLEKSSNNSFGKSLNKRFLNNEVKIPLPPKEIQEKIITSMEIIEKNEEENKNKIQEYKNNIQNIMDEEIIKNQWEWVKLGDVCNITIGGTPDRRKQEYWKNGNNLWLSIAELNGEQINNTKEKINELGIKNSNVKLVKKGTILLSFKLSIGKVAIAGQDLYTNEAIAALKIKNEYLLNKYLFFLFKNKIINLEKSSNNSFGKSLNSTFLKNEVKIPFPPLEEQEKIVERIIQIEEKINILEAENKNLQESKKQVLEENL